MNWLHADMHLCLLCGVSAHPTALGTSVWTDSHPLYFTDIIAIHINTLSFTHKSVFDCPEVQFFSFLYPAIEKESVSS